MSSGSVLEELRVFKRVDQKIRSTLVSGREEMVSPTVVTRSFLDSFEKMVHATSLDSGISSGEREGSPNGHRQNECPFIEAADGWTVEYSHKNCEQCNSDVCVCPEMTPPPELRPLVEASFRQHFFQKEHWTFYTEEPELGPCILSIKPEADGSIYRLLVRSSNHYVHGVVGVGELVGGEIGRVDKEEVVSVLAREMGLETSFKPALFPDLQRDLLKIDETFVKSHHKVGVLRIRRGQSTEEEIFANGNEPGSHFDKFLNVLGKRVQLKGFQGFLGGLDSEKDMTGEHSVSTDLAGLEVMFHVAPLMPFDPNDPQQVNKKRHIGNDMVCVVFLENQEAVFNPTWVRSHFIHCYIVVQHVTGTHGQPLYRIGVASRSTVPSFTPELRTSGLFPHSRSLQQLILTKIINGERASYHAPKFLRLTNRSRAQLLLELTESLTECVMASKQGRATRKINRRGNWLPVGATRPPSPILDSVHQKHSNSDQLAEDFQVAFRGCELADVAFIVGDSHTPLYAVKAILACRSRVFRTMFQEGQAQSPSRRFTSPMIRKRLPTASCIISPQGGRKLSHSGAKPKLGMNKRKKSSQDLTRSSSPDPPSFFFGEDPRSMNIKEQYMVEDFDNLVFAELLSYLMTGQCSIRPETVVGIACVAERFEVEELKQACLDNLPNCLSVASICLILTQLEQYLSFAAAKTIVVQCLEFIDTNAAEILLSQQFLRLSENMVHLVLKRESSADLPEIMKVKAAFAWGELHSKPSGPDFKTLVTPLLKHIKLHLIDPQDIMKVLVPSGIFDMDKLMAALAYQVDPQSVEVENYTMFRSRKKTNVR